MVIETSALLLLALGLLTVPLNWLAAFLVAAVVHELFHILALRLLGGRADSLRVGAGGAVLRVEGLSPGREVLCALAGPLGSLSLLPLCPRFPRLALCALVQAAFNLLPIRPLDGGRAVCCALALLIGEEAALRWCFVLEILVCCGLLAAVIRLRLGIFPVFLTAGLILKALSRKIPCKLRLPGVQ